MALKLNQIYVYQFTTFSLLSNYKDKTKPNDMSENEMADELKKYSKEELQKKKKEFQQKLVNFKGIRCIRKSSINKAINDFLENKQSNVVSLFESDISRWIEKNKPENIQKIGFDKNLLKGIVFLKISRNHNVIMNQIIDNGLLFDGVEYCVYTAAAGQQRKTKLTLIEKSIMDEYIYKKYMCGLSMDKINQTGGLNTGKMLAYLALPLSASKPITIDIDKVIVVDDMELPVNKLVEFIDHENNFTHQKMNLPDLLNMTDGAGMILPNAMKKIEQQLDLNYPLTGFQIRSSWVKGAIFPFNFKIWCQEHDSSKVKDIWKNKEYDIIQDDIQMILTKSQLKTWGKYDSWQQYKDEFKKQELSFSATAINNPNKNNIQMAYQFLQTLDRDKANEEHIKALCNKSIQHYQLLHSDTNTILNKFGASNENEIKKPFQEALMLYPALLKDKWVKQKLERMVAGYKKDLLCGKIELDGFYGYAMPDMYAFCEWLFLGTKEPKGLIPDNYVYCQYYQDKDINRADILRSPHLNNEHTIRNILYSSECKEWFKYCGQNIIYSIHDYLMLCVQGDTDGDTLAIVPNDTLIKMVKPHDVLFYRMYKAPAQQITKKTIYNTLVNSFSCNKEGQSIGYISNAISKCWNQDVLDGETLNLIKYLTMKSNFTIDFPKTQKNIVLPKEIQKKYEEVSSSQFPYIFKYIKGKKNVNEQNSSVMNQLVKYIESNTKGCKYTYEVDDFDYSMLQSRNTEGDVIVDRSAKKYSKLQKLCYQFGSKVQSLSKKLKSIERDQNKENNDDELEENDANFDLTYSLCLMEMLNIYPDKQKLTDTLVDLCYCQKYPISGINNIMWQCCGDIIVRNIAINLKNNNYTPKTKTRMAYQTKDIDKVTSIKSKLDILLQSQKPIIYKHDIDTIQNIKNRNCQIIYYIFLCLCKIKNENSTFNHKIYIANGKKSKINKNKLLMMAELPTSTNFSKILNELKKLNLISVIEPKVKSGKIISLVDYNFSPKNDGIAFMVNNAWNPVIYYTAYNENKKICQCTICGNDFIKIKNKKTCSNKCAEILESNTKKDAYTNKKVDIAS